MALFVTNLLLSLPDGKLQNYNISFNAKDLFAIVDFLDNIQAKAIQAKGCLSISN